LKGKATSDATKRAYASDWAHFSRWCEALEVSALPADVDTVKEYVAALPSLAQSEVQGRGRRKEEKRGYSVATITRRLASIARMHKRAGLPNPCASDELREVMRGIRREVGTATRERDALIPAEHFTELRRQPETLAGLRDKAVLLFGLASAMRRSELAALQFSDLRFETAHVFAKLHRSKTDQEGKGREVCINMGRRLCPVTALREWVQAAAITEGAVFRNVGKGGRVGERLTPEGINLIVKRYCRRAGVEGNFGAHSLRAGFVTAAKVGGATDYQIMLQTGHKTAAMIDRYTRRYDLAVNNASGKLGL
jgi:integrase